MADNDMRHMEYLGNVLEGDARVLREKEATYQGSWKRAGGRSAWFMARRNMDRLIQMLAPPPRPEGFDLEDVVCGVQNMERQLGHHSDKFGSTVRGVEHMRDLVRAEDIFAKIEERPGGEDGTVLACVRDLRRYLTLVEAEMMARGVVAVEGRRAKPFDIDGTLHPDGSCEKVVSRTRELDPNFEAVISGGMVHERGRAPRPATDRDRARAAGRCGRDGEPIMPGDPCTWMPPGSTALEVHLERVTEDGRPALRLSNGAGWLGAEWRDLRLDPTRPSLAMSERRVPRYEKETTTRVRAGELEKSDTVVERTFEEPAKQRTPEDGAQHAGLAPFVVTPGYAERKSIDQRTFEKFWCRRGGDTWVLEPHVVSEIAPPPLLRDYYVRRGDHLTLRPGRIPADAREFFPRLAREHNMKEHEELPEWQRVLYTWNDSANKFELALQNLAWTGDQS